RLVRCGAGTGEGSTGVVHHDLAPPPRQQQGVGAAESPTASGDDRYPIVESQFRHSCSELDTVQVALFPPRLEQIIEGVEACHEVVTEERPDSLAETVALVVVIAGSAGQIERRRVDRELSDGVHPGVLGLLARL